MDLNSPQNSAKSAVLAHKQENKWYVLSVKDCSPYAGIITMTTTFGYDKDNQYKILEEAKKYSNQRAQELGVSLTEKLE